MTNICLVANDQLLAVSLQPTVAAGDVNSVKLHIDFSEDWDAYAKSAVFFTSNDETPYEKILTNGECLIPAEVLAEAGLLFIGVRGVNSGTSEVKTSTLVKYKIKEGAPEGKGTTVEPTASVYQQLLTAFNVTNSRINSMTAGDSMLNTTYELEMNENDGHTTCNSIRIETNGSGAMIIIDNFVLTNHDVHELCSIPEELTPLGGLHVITANSLFWYEDGSLWVSADTVSSIPSDVKIHYSLEQAFTPPELSDIRIGADGTVYGSAGEAVRSQVSALLDSSSDTELRAELEKAIGVVDAEPEDFPYEYYRDCYYSNSITEYADGDGKISLSNARASVLVEVTEGQKFFVSGKYESDGALVVEFDESQNFIRGIGKDIIGSGLVTDYEYIVPNGVAFVAFSSKNSNLRVGTPPTKETAFRKVGAEIDILENDVGILKEDVSVLNENAGSDTELRTELEKAIGVVSVTSDPEVLEIPRFDGYHYHKQASAWGDGDGKSAFSGAQCTELVSVTEGQTFYVTGQYGYLCCLIAEVDENKNFIQGVGTTESGTKIATDYEYTVPSGVSYVGFSTRNATTQPLIVKGSSVAEKVFRNIGNDVDVLTEDVAELKETVAGLKSGSGIENLANEVEKIKAWGIVDKNLYNPEKDTFGKRANDSGNVSLGLRCSEWIAVEPNSNYVLSNNGDATIAVVIALKNADDTLSTVESAYNLGGGLGYLITTPETATHIRFSTYTNSANDLMRDYIMLEKGNTKTEYKPYKIILDYKNRLPETMQNIWEGKKMVVDGDSITHDWAGYYWQFVASKILGMYIDTSVKSADDDENGVYGCGWRGIGGSTIADEEQAKINAGMTSNANPLSRSILLRHQNLPDDADIVLIAGGSNDWAHSVVEIGDFDSTDITTFNGALNQLLPSLKAKYPTIPVVMMTPIKRTETHNVENSKGYTLEDFVDAMIKKCRQYGVYCLDMWGTCPINPQIPIMLQMFFRENDSTHPNKAGHEIMGKTVAGFIRTLN